MAGRGVHFAINAKTAQKLIKLPRDERADFIMDEIEDYFFEQESSYLAQTDKAWDAIHRVLTDGQLLWENGEYPLNHAILAGELLIGGEANDDYLISLKTPAQVADISAALEDFSEEDFKQGYANIQIDDYEYNLGFEDLNYSYKWFLDLKKFYSLAARSGRYVIFTADL